MNVAYTTGDVKNLEGDASLRQQIDLPKDYCTPLAIETSGSLFSFPEGSASKKLMSTKAVTVLAKRIAQTSIPSECQHCECVADRDDVGVTRCSRCVSAGLNKFIQVRKVKEWFCTSIFILPFSTGRSSVMMYRIPRKSHQLALSPGTKGTQYHAWFEKKSKLIDNLPNVYYNVILVVTVEIKIVYFIN